MAVNNKTAIYQDIFDYSTNINLDCHLTLDRPKTATDII